MSRYNLGNIVDQFNDNQTSYELSGGISDGLIDGWTKRLTVRHALRPQSIPADAGDHACRRSQLPPDRTLSYPFVGFDILQDKYKKIGDENQIGRTEDLYFGTEISGEVGLTQRGVRRGPQRRDAAVEGAARIRIADLQQLFRDRRFLVAHRGRAGRAI